MTSVGDIMVAKPKTDDALGWLRESDDASVRRSSIS